MGGLIQSLVNAFINNVENSVEAKKVAKAIRESILREMRFNESIFKEIEHQTGKRKKLVSTLKNNAFNRIEDSFLPMNIIFEEKDLDTNVLLQDVDNGNIIRWFSNTKTNIELLEKVYHRIELLKILEGADIQKNRMAMTYSKFLIRTLKKLLKDMG